MLYSSLRRLAVLCPLLLASAWCAAQEAAAPGTPAEQAAPAAESRPSESDEPDANGVSERLEIYWVVDADGKLQPLLNVPLEKIEKLLRDDRGAGPTVRPAPYTIQRMSITGSAGTQNADLRVQLDITVRGDGWVDVPLRLDGAILKSPAEHTGSGEAFIQAEPAGKGYVAYVRGEPGAQHELALNLLVPLAVMGRETRLRLQAPRATLSDLTLTVPGPRAAATVSEGAALEEPVTEKGTTRFTVRGVGGDFQLSWHQAGPRPKVPVQLEAVGAVITRIGSRSVEAEAMLTVRSYGAPFDGFDVVLPPGARFADAVSPVGCSIEPLKDAGGSGEKPQVVAVRLEKPTAGPLEIGIATTRPHHVADPTEPFELAGFEVPGAVRQWGHVAVAAATDWQVDFGGVRGVVRTDELPEALQYDELVAGYEYVAQPYSLPVRLGPRKTRLSVEPEYQLLVQAGRMSWHATLNYTIRGAKAFELSVELPDWDSGWALDEVGPANLVDVDRAAVREQPGGPALLWIPLKQAATGALEIQYRAHRLLPEKEQTIAAHLSRPLADSVAPAALTVLPAENVSLTPDADAISGLTRQAATAPAEAAAPSHELVYRSFGGAATFVAEYGVRSQQIAVDVASKVDLSGGSPVVQQELQYAVAYEPAGQLAVEVPRELAELPQLEFRCENQLLEPVRPDAGDGDPAATVRMQLPLPETRIGPCQISVQYPIRVPPLKPGKPLDLEVPLVMPAGGKLGTSRLQVTGGERLSLESNDGRWTVSLAADESAPSSRIELHSREPLSVATLRLKPEKAESEGAAVVERAWVQTWLTEGARQDRAVFRLRSSRRELRLQLPAGADPAQLQVWLDGQRVAVRSSEAGVVAVPLPNDAEGGEHLLEFWGELPQPGRRPGRLAVDLPRLEGAWVRRMYWQLVLPQNEHLLTAPEGFTSEFRWDFDRLVWRREPLMNQAALEAWAGAPAQTPAPEGANQYLFSSLGGVAAGEVHTADRSRIVLIASGAALVAGLLLIYVPRSRHPAALLVAAAAMLSVGLIWPEPTVLFAQAASLGLGLTLLAGLLERGVARHRRSAAFPEPPASAVLDKGSSDTLYHPRPPAGSAPSSTAPSAISRPSSSVHS